MTELEALLEPTREFDELVNVLTTSVFRCRGCGQPWQRWVSSNYAGEFEHLQKFDPSTIRRVEPPWKQGVTPRAISSPLELLACAGIFVGLIIGLSTMPPIATGVSARRSWVLMWMIAGFFLPPLATGIIWLLARASRRPRK